MNGWIVGWLVIGVVVLAVDAFEWWLICRRATGERSRAIAAARDWRIAGRRAIARLAFSLFVPLLVIVWPAVLGNRIWRAWRFRHGALAPDGTLRPFAVAPRELLAAGTRAAIEAAETVRDPLNAAPELPFGHLNAAWRSFADALPPDAVLHAFRSDWRNQYGSVQRHEGYVAVVGGVPGAYFLTRVPLAVG